MKRFSFFATRTYVGKVYVFTGSLNIYLVWCTHISCVHGAALAHIKVHTYVTCVRAGENGLNGMCAFFGYCFNGVCVSFGAELCVIRYCVRIRDLSFRVLILLNVFKKYFLL